MIAISLNEALAAGRISNIEYCQHQSELAKAMYPDDPRTALTKFFASSVGREMLANSAQPPARDMFETYQKRHGYYGSQNSYGFATAANTDDTDLPSAVAAIKALVKSGMSFDQAATKWARSKGYGRSEKDRSQPAEQF